ncbi:hypothetical protein [Corynebacterium freiburgense]|uniref:hypothetical protein n=1 Tax=Corynebacterium freiburgense TaxID=556548 RepID=UPI00040DE504|nr:hypothetical protein [Corynebacterium freiburgense]WJZ03258.1 hypothetical protein CFREI_09905 [Corynebacterium freiburgense]
MALDKISAREWLIQRHGACIADDWKLAELSLNSLMDQLDQNDTGLSAEQVMEIALAEVLKN